MKVFVETSARHVHVTEELFALLFGKDAVPTVKKMLSQPGQFACNERVKVIGPRRELANVSILGPFRKQPQVELSSTDCRSIGINAVVRESGDIGGTPGCILSGPCGEAELKEGVIVAKRHIHMTPEQAKAGGFRDKEIVSVRIDTPDRPLTFGNVVIRVRSDFAFAMHIDTDEANAASVGLDTYGEIIKEEN